MTRPPLLQDHIAKIVERYLENNGRLPTELPQDPQAFAELWVDLMEPPRGFLDNPEPIKDQHGQVVGWITPYHDRISYYLKKFLKFNKAQKVWIIRQMRRGIVWRGDDGLIFAELVKQHEEMIK